MSRRNGDSPPVDHIGTRRSSNVGLGVARLAPKLSGKLCAVALERRMKAHPLYRDEWQLLPAGPLPHSSPVMNDHLIDLLADGSITSVGGIGRFLLDGTTVELSDGTTLLNIDAVIYSTGYRYSFDIVEAPGVDPTATPTPEWDAAKHRNGVDYPRLYMGLFAPAYPDSLAFLGAYRGHSPSAFCGVDLIGQAIAQVWIGAYPLPPLAEIERWCDDQYQYMLSQVAAWHIHKPGLPPGDLEKWLNAAAGNGMDEMLGWSWKAWKFWWSDRRLYRVVMDEVDTPSVYRLFDGRRKKWDGARDAILRTNGKAP